MGNLKALFFVASPDEKGKVTDKIIPTLNVTYENINELLRAVNTDKRHTVNRQATDNTQTTTTDKKVAIGHEAKGLQNNLSTGLNKCGIRLNGNMDISNPLPTTNKAVRPQEQTNEEWLNDWGNA